MILAPTTGGHEIRVRWEGRSSCAEGRTKLAGWPALMTQVESVFYRESQVLSANCCCEFLGALCGSSPRTRRSKSLYRRAREGIAENAERTKYRKSQFKDGCRALLLVNIIHHSGFSLCSFVSFVVRKTLTRRTRSHTKENLRISPCPSEPHFTRERFPFATA